MVIEKHFPLVNSIENNRHASWFMPLITIVTIIYCAKLPKKKESIKNFLYISNFYACLPKYMNIKIK